MAGQRRGNGEGTIAKRKDGRWCAAIFMPTTDGGEKRIYVYGRTRDEVRDKLTELQEKRRRNIPVPTRAWKLDAYLDYWLEQVVRPSKRWNTYKKYEIFVRIYLKPGLGKRPLTRLRVAEVQAFFNDQLRAGHSIAKVHAMRMVLAAALTRAMRDELIFTNSARLATLPTAPPARNRPWSADEARRFLDAASNDPLYPAFVLLLVYGLRRGEVLGLSWEDVDLEEDLIHVDWQLQRMNGKLTRTQVKTDAGQRILPLLPIARDALLDLALWQSNNRRHTGNAWHETGYVFTTRTGQPVEPRDLVRSFERIIRHAGLRPIRLHDLRHTVAQFLKKLRTAPNDAKEILGHARITTTLAIYTSGDEDDQRSALDKISDLLFQEPEKQ
jgi:integrase